SRYCHTYAAAWSIFSCLRARPSSWERLSDSVEWLIDQRPSGWRGWGHVKTSPSPRAFNTAYVLNSILEYLECTRFANAKELDLNAVNGALRDGVRFLSEDARNKASTQHWVWDLQAGANGMCLATTAIALHVLAKVSRLHPELALPRELLLSTWN